MERFRWCFIGCGNLGGRVARQITESGRHAIVSVYARGAERRGAFARQYGAYAASTAEEAIGAPGVDGVYVVTPHPSHDQYARLAIEMGRPVLCEKPFMVSASRAEKVFRLAREKKVYAAEAMWTWFSPVANGVKKWLDEGAFGEVVMAEGAYRAGHEGVPARLTDPHMAGGALLDIGVYPLTYLYRLFGPPEAVRCTGAVAEGIDWQESIELAYPGGRTFRAAASIVDQGSNAYISIEGTKGSVYIPTFYGADAAELARPDGTRERVEGDGSFAHEFDAVAAEIRAGLTESKAVPPSATVGVLKIMDECRRQMGLKYPFES